MTNRFRRAGLAAVAASALAALAVPATAQTAPATGVPTETQERLARGVNNDFDWGLLGLLGLAGLLGLRERKEPDWGHAI